MLYSRLRFSNTHVPDANQNHFDSTKVNNNTFGPLPNAVVESRSHAGGICSLNVKSEINGNKSKTNINIVETTKSPPKSAAVGPHLLGVCGSRATNSLHFRVTLLKIHAISASRPLTESSGQGYASYLHYFA